MLGYRVSAAYVAYTLKVFELKKFELPIISTAAENLDAYPPIETPCPPATLSPSTTETRDRLTPRETRDPRETQKPEQHRPTRDTETDRDRQKPEQQEHQRDNSHRESAVIHRIL